MKKKRKKFPGVTLLELVIVLAIFSGISVGAMAMVRPAMQLHYKTAAQERAVAAVDTMARFIQDNLRYADKMLVYINHGIEDVKDADGNVTKKGIDIIQDYPFDYFPFIDEGMKFVCQEGTNSYELDGTTPKYYSAGQEDPHHYVNPVSLFLQYYFEESIGLPGSGYARDKINAYFKDKVIYVMEIKNDTGEVNVYSYPLYKDDGNSIYGADGDSLYGPLIKGVMGYKEHDGSRGCSSISDLFSGGKEKIDVNVKDIDKKGLNIELSINYDGATIKNLTLNYNIAVNFINLASSSDTIYVNDKYPYEAERYFVFDWDGKKMYPNEKKSLVEGKLPETGVKNKGYTYIVYSLPEIIP